MGFDVFMQLNKIFSTQSVGFYNDYNYLSVSEVGKVRESNEDSLGIFKVKEGLLLIICDGLGGGLSGEFAAKSSIDSIHRYFTESKEKDILKRIKKAIQIANHLVFEKSNGNLHFKGMATTCEVLLLNGMSAYWGHVGDSRIYYFIKNRVTQLTKDHSFTQKLIDDGVLTAKNSDKHPKKSVVTKAIGVNKIFEVDTSKMLLAKQSRSKFFLCTDGVTTVVNNFEIEKLLELEDLSEISEKFKKLIKRRGAPDNYSFILVSA